MTQHAGSASVIGPFPPLKGGIAQHTAQVADGFDQVGFEVSRLGWVDQYPKLAYGRDQIDTSAQSTPGVEPLLRWWSPASWIRSGRTAALGDLAHWSYVTPVHAIPQLVMMRLARRSVRVLHVHNVEPHERFPLWRSAVRAVANQADVIVCHAESLRRQLRELEINGPPILVVPHPPDLAVCPTPLPEGPPKLLFAGTIRPYKGLDLLFEALAEVAGGLPPGTSLTVAGEVWDQSQVEGIRRFADRAEVATDLRLNYQSDADLIELLRAHHLLVAPYRSATQSGIVSLALAAGRPALATRVGGLPDLVHDGVNGVLTDVSAQSVAEGLMAAISDLQTLAVGARSTQTSWSDYVNQVQQAATRITK